eukprot:15340361-Ditylum_brightwellii.AAC.1
MLKLATIIWTNEGGSPDSTCTIRLLNSNEEVDVPTKDLSPYMTNNPANIPTSVKDIDPNAMESLLTHEDLEKLWHKDQVTISDAIRLYLYWHQRLQHPPHVSMVRLAERKVIRSAIKHIQKVSPCAACLFAKAQRRAWRNQQKKLKTIRKGHHTTL